MTDEDRAARLRRGMARTDPGREIRRQIDALVAEYYAAEFGIPPFEPGVSRVPYAGRVFDAEELVALVDASLEFWLTYGHWSREFEVRLAKYLKVEKALFVNSGSSANLLAFSALTSEKLGDHAVRPGDEVITVAAGFPTTVAPIVQRGAVPVFVDVLLNTANVDVDLLADAVSPRTKAVMLAHTLGNPFNAVAVQEFCRDYGLWFIEDNCDALGSRLDGRRTGTFGHIATSSFYPPHHMTTGEGGAAYTSDGQLAEIMLSMRDWGRDCVCPPGRDDTCGERFSGEHGTLPPGYDHKYVFSEFGYNLKATDLQAAIGCVQLDRLDSFVEARRRNFQRLHDALAPLSEQLMLPEATPDSEPSWFGFLIVVREDAKSDGGRRLSRDGFVHALEDANVQTRMLFAGNMVRQPAFDRMREAGEGFRVVGDLANTDRLMRDAFWVGVYPGLTDEAIDFMASVIAKECGR